MKPVFYIRTFGCQMNKNDSAIISSLLVGSGMTEVDTPEQADIVIINTCSVRGHAEQRALGHIATLRSWRERRGRVLAVVGCMAQRNASMLMTEYPFVDCILGPDSYRAIASHVTAVLEKGTRIRETGMCQELYSGIYPRSGSVSDFVSIMRGCSNFCSYCVVPYVRGPARSRPAEDILKQVAHLVAQGVKDITLLGQNVNEYDHGSCDFAGLLERIARAPGVCRIRFLTSHPRDLDQRTIRAVAGEPALCEWFHLPMQSGNDRILQLMNRGYSAAHYQDLVARIRDAVPHAAVTTDIIVGFPTESDKEFLDTIDAVKDMQFDDAYMYRYSHRSGTAAAQLDSLPEDVIKERLLHLINVQARITRDKTGDMPGRRYEVLFEEAAKQGGTRGKTRGNKDVIVASEIVAGTVAEVEIQAIQGRTPIGKIIT